MNPGISIKDVHVRFGRTTVLRGVNLDVPVGTTTVLLGANGTGKSTLLRACAGLLRRDGGSIEIAGLREESRRLLEPFSAAEYRNRSPSGIQIGRAPLPSNVSRCRSPVARSILQISEP